MLTKRCTLALLAFSFTLTACQKQPVLPPEEVIRRSVIKSNTVQSFAVSLSAKMNTVEVDSLSGSVVLQAIVRSGGRAWRADTSFDIESTMSRGHERASGRIVAVFPGNGRTFLRLESSEGVLGTLLRQSFTGSTSGWMMYGEESGMTVRPRATPDPDYVLSYADAIVVTEDLGKTKNYSGRETYHYRVALKPEALLSIMQSQPIDVDQNLRAEGELWIDSENYSLLRATWKLVGVPTSLGAISLDIDALFSQYDSAPRIETPFGSAATLPLDSIFDIFSL